MVVKCENEILDTRELVFISVGWLALFTLAARLPNAIAMCIKFSKGVCWHVYLFAVTVMLVGHDCYGCYGCQN
jgi:hypothetical protein